jgi:hypothetical protein
VLSTTAAESRDGMNRSYENALAELEHRHGVEGAQGIIADAKAAAAQLPKRAFEFLEDWNLANDPTVVSRFGLAWRNRRTAAR